MYTIPKTKFGKCHECGKSETQCVKNGKNLYCIDCRNNQKRREMMVRIEKKEQKRADGHFKDGLIDKESLMYDLDFVFSRYIRIKEANPDGIAECYTCDKREHWTKLQAGHFIKRSETFLRWDTRNVRPQCVECNCLNHGNIEVYSERLENEQPGIVETLKEQSKDVYKYTREDMKELLVDLRAKLKIVQSKLK